MTWNKLRGSFFRELGESGESFEPGQRGCVDEIGEGSIPEEIAAEDYWRLVLHHDNGIATGVPREVLDTKRNRTETQLGGGIVKHIGRGEIFYFRFLFRGDVLAKKF